MKNKAFNFGRILRKSKNGVHDKTKRPKIKPKDLKQTTIKIVTKCSKMSIVDYIWNHHKDCIEISTNMPGITEWILLFDSVMTIE